MQEELRQRLGRRGRVLGRLPHDRVAAQQRRHEVPGGHRDREVARGDDRGDADRHAEREQLLVGHLRRHGLAVEPPALAEEEVAGVDDLLHLAERLGVGLADLARDQAREGLLVVLDQPPELLDRAAAHRRRDAAHSRWAARAASQAATKVPASPSRTSATISSVSAGLVEVVRPPGASVAARPAMIEPTVRDMALNLARVCCDPPGARLKLRRASGRPATGATPPSSLLSCSPASCSSPAAAQAATPGVNIAGVARAGDASTEAMRPGAKYVRVFVRWDDSSPTTHAHASAAASSTLRSAASAAGVKPSSSSPARRRGQRRRRPAAAFATRRLRALRRPACKRSAASPPTRSGTSRTRPTSGAPRPTPARYAAHAQGRLPGDQAADPSARSCSGRLTGNNYNFLGQVYAAGAGGSFDAVAVHTDTACLRPRPERVLPRGRQDRALHVPRLPHRPRRDGRQRRRRQADLDDRAGLDVDDVDLRARRVGGQEARRRQRGQPGRVPQAGLPLPRRPTPTSEAGLWFTLQGHHRATATSSTTTACCAPTARPSPRGTPSASVARSGDQLTGPCGDFDAPSLTDRHAGHQRALRAGADHQRRRHRRQQRRAHDLPGRRQRDPQLHRRRRGLRQGRRARRGRARRSCPSARTRSRSSRWTRRATRVTKTVRSRASRRCRRR